MEMVFDDASPDRLATLIAMTPEAEWALMNQREVHITHFPFRFGRENRLGKKSSNGWNEKRLGVERQLNDIYLLDQKPDKFLRISRAHFAIECVNDEFFLVDRGSTCGTIVEGVQVGGHGSPERTRLEHGNVIVVGTEHSPYVFRFEVSPPPD